MATLNPDESPGSLEGPFSVPRWCARHDLIGALLPFRSRRRDTFAEFEQLARRLDKLPDTAATFTLDSITDEDDDEDEDDLIYRPSGAGIVESQLHLLGAWEGDIRRSRRRWINPSYIHDHPWQQPQCSHTDRVRILRHAAYLGRELQEVTPRFGIEPSTLWGFVSRNDIPYSRWVHRGRIRLAKTIDTIAEWRGCDRIEVIAPFQESQRCIEARLSEHVDEGWSPPPRPSSIQTTRRCGCDQGSRSQCRAIAENTGERCELPSTQASDRGLCANHHYRADDVEVIDDE